MATAAGVERRKIQYDRLDDLIEDVQKLRSGPYRRAGQWTLTQNCEHLDRTMRSSMTSMAEVPMGWLIRATVGRIILGHILKTRKLGGRIEAAPALRPESGEQEDPARIDQFIDTVRTLATAMTFDRSPFFGVMTPEEWRAFHLIHAAHHLSHIVP